MKRLFDDAQLPLKCPKCGHTTQQRIAFLKTNPSVTCHGCGETIQVKADDLRRELDKVQREIDRLGFKVR